MVLSTCPHPRSPLSVLLAVGLLALTAATTVLAAPTLVALRSSVVGATLDPAFSPDITVYQQVVPFSASKLQFKAITDDTPGTTLAATWKGGEEFPIASNVATKPLFLDAGENFAELQVILRNPNFADVVYTLDIVRSSVVGRNAALIGFGFNTTDAQASAGLDSVVQRMDPDPFSSQTQLYNVELREGVTEFRFTLLIDATATATMSTAVLASSGATAAAVSNVAIENQALSPVVDVTNVQLLQLNVTVAAEDTTTRRTYTFFVRPFQRAPTTPPSSTGGASNLPGGEGTTTAGAETAAPPTSSTTGPNGGADGEPSNGGDGDTNPTGVPGSNQPNAAARSNPTPYIVPVLALLLTCWLRTRT